MMAEETDRFMVKKAYWLGIDDEDLNETTNQTNFQSIVLNLCIAIKLVPSNIPAACKGT